MDFLFFLVQKMKNSPLFSINEYIFQFFTKKDKEIFFKKRKVVFRY
jgi:hypothetical protein